MAATARASRGSAGRTFMDDDDACMLFRQITHDDLGCASYLIGDEDAGVAAVVDPKLDIEDYLALARYVGVSIEHVLETHNHAHHLSRPGPRPRPPAPRDRRDDPHPPRSRARLRARPLRARLGARPGLGPRARAP